MSISKMSRSANQPVAVGSILSTSSRRQKRNPRRAEQVLEHAGGEEVAAERAYVDRQRADGLVGVDEDKRAPLVRKARDRLDVEPAAVTEADARDRNERGLLVDRRLEPLDRNRPVGLAR